MTEQDQEAIAKELVNELHRPDGDLHMRPVHTLGIGATGFFEASPVAKDYCIAAQFQGGKIPVTVRYSNGSGSAQRHDGWSDLRGMATRFHLPDGTDTDLVMMTLPAFFAPTPQSTLDFEVMVKPTPYTAETPWQKIKNYFSLILPRRDPYPGETISPDMGAIEFANIHRYAQLSVSGAYGAGAPVSYARIAYHAVHCFIITGPDGTKRWVRFSWQPVAGVLKTNPNVDPKDVYLDQELRKRLSGQGEARFSLMMTIGEAGDDFEDSTTPWPPHRIRVMMGMVTLNHVPDEKVQKKDIEKMSYNPCLLTEGIEPSEDPILNIRRHVYKWSSKERGGHACPFHGGDHA